MKTTKIAEVIAAAVALTLLQPTASPSAIAQERRSGPVVPPGTKVLRDMEYIPQSHARHKLDLYLPATGTNWPLIVWVHGGAWRAGSKDNCPALRFLNQGYAVASINYRLSQHAQFPAQILDAKAAIRWLRANAAPHGYNPNRIGVWGSSAGGHLVALLGTTGDAGDFESGPNLDVPSRVQCVVDFFGPSDLTLMQQQAGDKGLLDHDAPDSPESQLIGGPIQDNKDKAAKANPINYISRADPPFLICHGDEDFIVPLAQSELLHAALQQAGVESTLHIVKGAGHGFRDPQVDDLVAEFFRKHLSPDK